MSANEQSRTMLDAILAEPSDKEKIAQGSLPGGCLLHLETALTYARKAKLECRDGGNHEVANDWMAVVVEHLEEIQKKVRKAGNDD